jgi:translin
LVTTPSRADDLATVAAAARAELAELHEAREVALRACRSTIQAAGRTIRAIHRGDKDHAASAAEEASDSLEEAHRVLAVHPAVAAAGFLHDGAFPTPSALGVGAAAWLNGLAEAASELRRHLLDRLRAGDLDRAEAVLAAMDDVYGVLVTVDFPDSVTGGLRRTTDGLRAVLERTRSDLTTTMLQSRLQAAIVERLPPG